MRMKVGSGSVAKSAIVKRQSHPSVTILKSSGINVVRLTTITIVLIDITIAVLLLYRPKFPRAEPGRPKPLQVTPAFMSKWVVLPPVAALSNYCALHRRTQLASSSKIKAIE
jgi:hypothetical protein